MFILQRFYYRVQILVDVNGVILKHEFRDYFYKHLNRFHLDLVLQKMAIK